MDGGSLHHIHSCQVLQFHGCLELTASASQPGPQMINTVMAPANTDHLLTAIRITIASKESQHVSLGLSACVPVCRSVYVCAVSVSEPEPEPEPEPSVSLYACAGKCAALYVHIIYVFVIRYIQNSNFVVERRKRKTTLTVARGSKARH